MTLPSQTIPRAFKIEQHLTDAYWHLLVGKRETRALARWLRLHPASDDTHIDHDVRMAVFDSQGAFRRIFEGWNFDQGYDGALSRDQCAAHMHEHEHDRAAVDGDGETSPA